jgi:hypothetical protein
VQDDLVLLVHHGLVDAEFGQLAEELAGVGVVEDDLGVGAGEAALVGGPGS